MGSWRLVGDGVFPGVVGRARHDGAVVTAATEAVVEKCLGEFGHARVVHFLEVVAGHGDDFKRGIGAGSAQSRDEGFAGGGERQRIGAAVDGEQGGGVFRRVLRGAELTRGGEAEVIHHGLHAAGLFEVAERTLEGLLAPGDAEQRGQATTGAGAPNADAVGVHLVLGRVGAQPAHGGFAVRELRGEANLRALAVINTGHHVAVAHEPRGGGRVPGGVLAVNPQHHGARFAARAGDVQVHAQRDCARLGKLGGANHVEERVGFGCGRRRLRRGREAGRQKAAEWGEQSPKRHFGTLLQ
jgi:hypothetical protein